MKFDTHLGGREYIAVNQVHIENGKVDDIDKNPIALAIKDHGIEADVEVQLWTDAITCGDGQAARSITNIESTDISNGVRIDWDHDEEMVGEWLSKFYAGESVGTFVFDAVPGIADVEANADYMKQVATNRRSL